MEHLRGSVNLRSYGGRDPFIEYRREGLRLFKELESSLSVFVAEAVARIGDAPVTEQRSAIILPPGERHGRNDRVIITNGTETKEMKYKKAEEFLAKGWHIVNPT
jgi:preprotein translocase subunit SecA